MKLLSDDEVLGTAAPGLLSDDDVFQPTAPAATPAGERTWGEAASDTGKAIMQGGAQLARGLHELSYQLIPAGALPFEEDLLAALDTTPEAVFDAEADLLRNSAQSWQQSVSPQLQQKRQALGQAEGVGGTLGTLFDNPELIADVGAQQVLPLMAQLGVVSRVAPAVQPAVGIVTEAVQGAGESGVSARDMLAEVPEETLMLRPEYAARVAEIGQDAARRELADSITRQATATGAAVTAILGKFLGDGSRLANAITGEAVGGLSGAARKVATEGLSEALQEPAQGAAVAAAVSRADEKINPWDLDERGKEAVLGFTMGAAQGAGMQVTQAMQNRFRQQLEEQGVDTTNIPDEQLVEEIRGWLTEANEASAPATAEQTTSAIEQNTGTDTAAPLAGDARNNRTRELADVFVEDAPVYRRDDLNIDPVEGDASIPENTTPVQDQTGTPMTADSLVLERQAQQILRSIGAPIEPQTTATMARYLQAGLDPRSAANAFTRAARQQDMNLPDTERAGVAKARTAQMAQEAFDVADARRGRADTTRNKGRSARDFRAGASQDYLQPTPQGPDDADFWVPTPDELAAQVQEGRITEQEAAQLAEIREFRDAGFMSNREAISRAKRVLYPEQAPSPRMRQELETASRRVPSGVNQGQPGGPRNSVDRITTTDTGGMEGDFIPAGETAPPSGRPGTQTDQPAADTQAPSDTTTAPGEVAPQAPVEGPQGDSATDTTTTTDSQPRLLNEAQQREKLSRGRELVDSQLQDSPLAEAGFTPEQWDLVVNEITERSTDAVTGWLDARSGSMKSDAAEAAISAAREGESVVFINMDIANLGGLNKFFNDVASKANAEYRKISDAVINRLVMAGGTLEIRTGGDEFGVYVSGITEQQAADLMQEIQSDIEQIARDGGYGDIRHEKKNQDGYGVKLHWATETVTPDSTASSIYDSADAKLKQAGDADDNTNTGTAEERQQGPEQEPSTAEPAQAVAEEDAGETGAEAESGVNDKPSDKPGPSTALYAGIPLDRIAAAVKRAIGGESEAFRHKAEQIGELIALAKEWKKARSESPESLIGKLWRVTFASLDGDMRVLTGMFNSPTAKKLADLFHATAGSDAGVEQTFDEATQARNKKLQQVDQIVSIMRDAKMNTPSGQRQIIALLENPKTPRRGIAGEIANRIEKFLKDELAYLREAGVEVGEVRDGYFPREMDMAKVIARADVFRKQAKKAYMEIGQDAETAELSARAYWESLVFGISGRPGVRNQGGDTPKFTQSRVFTKAAAKHLQDFQVTDIDAVLGQYTMRATKRAEIARRFGDNWSEWEAMENAMVEEDPNIQNVLPQIRDRVALSAGVRTDGVGDTGRYAMSMIRTITTLATLPKSAMASLGELVVAPIRGTTGDIPQDMAAALTNILAHGHNMARWMTGMGRSEAMEGMFDLAEDVGIIAGEGHNSLMAARFAGGDPVGKAQSTVLSEFFKRNLLEYLTNYTRVTSMRYGQTFMRRLAKQMERNPQKAGVFLRELGVPKGKEAEFAEYVRGFGNALPGVADVSGPMGKLYRNGLQRFVDQTVMRPSASTRPKWASHPTGAMIFQLQAFGYAFQKNVINRAVRVNANSDLGKLERVAFSASMLATVAMLVAVQGLVRYARDELYNPEVNDRKTDWAFIEGALSQAGLFGVADPYLQSLSGVRYQKSLLQSVLGPAMGGLGDASDDVLAAALTNSDNTNTAERNLAKSVYDWLIEPLLQTLLTAVPGGPLTGPARTGLTVYAVPQGRDPFADLVAGEKDSKRKDPPIMGALEFLLMGATSGGSSDSRSSRSSSRSSRSSSRSSDRTGDR